MKEYHFFALKGEVIISIDEDGITTNKGSYYFYHERDCCEQVGLYKTIGNKDKLIGKTITLAESDSNTPNFSFSLSDSSCTWSNFYLEVEDGARFEWHFLGESNGYYDEIMRFYKN